MSFSDVSGVSNHFATANEGFNTTTSGTVSSGASIVGLISTAGLTNGSIFVGVIEPGTAKEQMFTGTVNTASTQITGVVWTKNTNVDHASGVSVVDYDTGTAFNMMRKGILVGHNQDGTHKSGATYLLPVIADFTNATHNHANAAGGGQISNTALLTASGLSYRLGLNTKTTTGTIIPTSYTTYATVAATSLAKEVEVHYGINLLDGASGGNRSGNMRIQVDGVTITGSDVVWRTNVADGAANSHMLISHTPTAASHTWTLQVIANTASASLLDQAYLRINQIV